MSRWICGGPFSTTPASARHLFAVWKAASISFEPRKSKYCVCKPKAVAACSVSLVACAFPGISKVPRTATRERFGRTSFRSSTRLPLNSRARLDNPVTFPPGRARLATNLLPTGSASLVITIGMTSVAFLAGAVTDGPAVTMTSTFRRTSSLARAGRRSNFPSA